MIMIIFGSKGNIFVKENAKLTPLIVDSSIVLKEYLNWRIKSPNASHILPLYIGHAWCHTIHSFSLINASRINLKTIEKRHLRAYISHLITIYSSIERTFCTLALMAKVLRFP